MFLIGFWGLAYFRSCVQKLTAASSPVEYSMETKGGPIKLRAESVAITMSRNFIVLNQVSAREPDGKLLASVKSANIMGMIPPILGGPRVPVWARARDVYGRIERTPGGRLRLLDYLPPKTAEESNIPYHVEVDRINLLFEDYRGGKRWQSTANVPKVRMDGVGSRWVASARADIEKVGALISEIRSDPDMGLTIDGRADRTNLLPLITHILATPDVEQFPELKSVSARSFVVTGPLRLFIPKEGKAEYEANIVADAADFAFKDQISAPSVHFQGVLTHAGLKGEVNASGPAIQANYVGALSWGEETVVGGALKATIARSEAAPEWLRRFLPKGARFEKGTFDGWVAMSGANKIVVDGAVAASLAEYNHELLLNPRARVNASTDRVALQSDSGTWNGATVKGALNYLPKGGQIEGLLMADNVSLGVLAQKFGVKNVRGSSDVKALIQGTSQAPVIAVRATGNAQATAQGRRFNLGQMVAAADFAGGKLNLTRLSVKSPEGVATAKGTWNQKTNLLDIDLVGSGVPLSILTADLKGRASFMGKVAGKPSAPQAKGRIEVYGAEYKGQQVPLAFADVTANRREVVANNFEVFKNATRATGSGSLDLATQAVSGTAHARSIQLTDWTKQAVGSIDVPDIKIGGTLKHLKINGSFDGKNIVASGIKVDAVHGEVALDGSKAAISNGLATFEQGSLSASATYDLNTSIGAATAKANGIDLGRLMPLLPEETTVAGLLNGDFNASFDRSGIRNAQGQGNLQDVRLNDVYLGGGPFALRGGGEQWSGDLGLGTLDSFLEINNATYNTKTKVAHAETNAKNFSLRTTYAMLKRYIASETDPLERRQAARLVLPANVSNELDTLAGSLDFSATLNGLLTDPSLTIPNATLSNISVGGRPSGTLTAQVNRANRAWEIGSLNWTGGPGNLNMQGTIEEHGQVDVEGDFHNLNPQWLALFDPSLSRFTGDADVFFNVTGPTRSPEISSSFYYAEGSKDSADRRQVNVRANVKEGSITAEGSYFYNGFTGPITAFIPFNYPLTIPADKELTANITLPPRALPELQPLFPWLDTKRTQGTIQGALTLSGPKDQLKVQGDAQVDAPVLAMSGVDTTLNSFGANAKFDGTALTLSAAGQGSQGGSVSLQNGSVTLTNLSDALGSSLRQLLNNQVGGNLVVDHLKVVQKGNAPINATIDGKIDASGRLRSPKLEGKLAVVEGSLSVPAAPEATEENITPLINPQFAIGLSMPNPVGLTAGTGNFQLTGEGQLAGTLTNPDLDIQLLVEKGTIRLPNARIGIDPGGLIHIVYRATPYGTATARANLDLAGTTALTANPYGGTIQRYDVELQIRGDLLSENGLQLSASANPPDLSQDQILTLLGQGGLFAQRPGASSPFRADQQLTTALYTALPLLFDPFTSQVASTLGLDYLSIEYNAYERVAITAAKSLSRNLVLSARRQLSNPLPGRRLDWDIRLAYRLPFRGKVFRNFNFHVGADQDRPWKIGLEYGFRF